MVANNVIEFKTARSRLTGRNRKEALPVLFSAAFAHLQAHGTSNKRLIGQVEAEAGQFIISTFSNGHGHYVRVDRGMSRLFTGYWHSANGYHVMTWRRHPSWEGAFYDEIQKAIH